MTTKKKPPAKKPRKPGPVARWLNAPKRKYPLIAFAALVFFLGGQGAATAILIAAGVITGVILIALGFLWYRRRPKPLYVPHGLDKGPARKELPPQQ